MNYLLFVIYLVVLCWLLLRIPFIKNAGISSKALLTLFLIKIVAGIVIGWVSLHVYGPGNDYWDLNHEAWIEYKLLLTEPGKYFSNIFTSDYEGGYSGIFNSFNSYWNDLRGNMIIKLVSVFNIFSQGDYYINSLFFNFIVFFGHIVLYRLFTKRFPGRDGWVIIGCFLLPSTLYFVSGIHKDGIVFLLQAVLIYSVYQSLHKNRFTSKRLSLILLSLLLVFLVRNFILLALVPALLAWILSAKTKWNTVLTFVGVYLISGFLFFGISSINAKIDPPAIIVKKQADYQGLPQSATQIELDTLQPNFKSFASKAPMAMAHVLLLPFPGQEPVNSLLPFSFELFFYLFLFLRLLMIYRKKQGTTDKPFLYFILFFTFTVFLFVGYTVPNVGSIIRYRSLYFPFLITPLLGTINWKRIRISI